MFFGCSPCCGGECPNYENVGIVNPLSLGFTARIQQPAARYFLPNLSTPTKSIGVVTDAIDEELTENSTTFPVGFRVIETFAAGSRYRFTTQRQVGTGIISASGRLVLPGRGVPYAHIRVIVDLNWNPGAFSTALAPRPRAYFYEIPCRQNVSPQADDSKTTMTFSAESRPGGASSVASLFSIDSASVHGGGLSASAPFPTIPANVARSPSEPAELGFSISGDRAGNPSGANQLTGAPGSLPWNLTFSGYHLSEITTDEQSPGSFPVSAARVASTFSVSVNTITDANGASASVSAFASSYSSIPAGPMLRP